MARAGRPGSGAARFAGPAAASYDTAMSMPPANASPSPHFADASDEGWAELGGGVRRRVRLALPEMMMVEFDFPAGGVGALHSHPHVQSSYVRSGGST